METIRERAKELSPRTGERPLICYPHEVKAILDGRQTQFRRVMDRQPGEMLGRGAIRQYNESGPFLFFQERLGKSHKHWSGPEWICPYGERGTYIWVKEALACDWLNFMMYAVDERPITSFAGTRITWPYKRKRLSAHHMSRSDSRIYLQALTIRAEPLQTISEADARSEGVGTALRAQLYGVADDKAVPLNGELRPSYRNAFATLWDGLNGQCGYSWDTNPWVWVVEFRRVR